MILLSRILTKNPIHALLAAIFGALLCGLVLSSCARDDDDSQTFPELRPYRDILRQCGTTTDCDIDEPDALLYENDLLRLPARLAFSDYVKLSPDSILQVKLHSLPRKAQAVITVESDGLEAQSFSLENRREQRFDLSRFSGKIVKITFAARPSSSKALADSATLEWAAIQLAVSGEHAPADAPVASLPAQFDVQDVLQKLQTYDVIYVVFDAFNAKHSNVYGYPEDTTPFLAQLSQEALVFERMFAAAPYTLASTGSLFTSTYPFEHGLTNISRRLGKIVPTLAELLTNTAVETCLITGHGFFSPEWGLQRGFSTVFHGPRYGRYPRHIITALKTIYAQHSEKRKFIYIHCGPPHFPYNPPEQFRTRIPAGKDGFLQPTKAVLQKIDSGELRVDEEQMAYLASFYDANVAFADDIARQIVTYLQAHGHLSKSILIVSSDHGEAFFEHQRMLHSTTVYDEMLHVPFLVRLPDELHIPPRRIGQLTGLIDVAPTLAEMFAFPDQLNFSGTSLWPLMFYDLPIHDVVYASTSAGMSMVRDLEYKYMVDGTEQKLFDLQQDPGERDNLSEQKPIATAYYRRRHHAFRSDNDVDESGSLVDRGALPQETLESLRELGYIN